MNEPSNLPGPPPASSIDASSDPITDILAECLRAQKEEHTSRLEEACDRHPELAALLRERFAVLQALGLEGLAEEPVGAPAPPGSIRDFGDFELMEEIGRGGMGVVHRARQKSLGRDVVIKLIRPELLHFGRSRERFQREAEAVGRLQHPGIVPIHSIGEHDGVPYFAMERVDGRSLDDLLKEVVDPPRVAKGATVSAGHGHRTWTATVLQIGVQTADALHHAHQRGILHRDVKPSNILVDQSGTARLIDFGLHVDSGADDSDEDPARRRLTESGSAPGTLLYMAPEQLELGVYDARSEVYALAATLYELIALRPPFKESSRSETERAIRGGVAPMLRTLQPGLAQDVAAVIHRALATDPTRRYVDMAAFEDDLKRASEGRAVAAQPDSLGYRLRRRIARQPLLAAATTAALVLGIGAPTVLMVQAKRHGQSLERLVLEERDARLASEDMARFMTELLAAADPYRSEVTPAVKKILQSGVDSLDRRLGHHPVRRAEAQRLLGRVHANLGLLDEGAVLVEESLLTLEENYRASKKADQDAEQQRVALDKLVQSRADMARIQRMQGRLDDELVQRRFLADELDLLHPAGSWRVLHARTNLLRIQRLLAQRVDGDGPSASDYENSLRETARAMESEEATASDRAALLGWFGSALLERAQSLDAADKSPVAEEALAALTQSISAFQESGEEHSLDSSTAKMGAALAAKMLGKLDVAETAYQSALKTFEARLGPNSVEVGIILSNLAGLQEARKDYPSAIESQQRGCEILEEVLGPDHQNVVLTAGNLAGMRYRGGSHEGLIEAYDDLIPRQEAALGRRRPEVGASYMHRGSLHADAGHTEKAREDFETSVEILNATLGATSATTKRARTMLEQLTVPTATGQEADGG